MLRLAALVTAVCAALAPLSARADGAWEPWVSVGGVFDLAGPMSDGSIVVAGYPALFTLTPQGAISPFAPGYRAESGGEPYVAVAPGLNGSACFARDEVFALRLSAPIGVTRVDTANQPSQLAQVSGVATLGGIAFDTTGAFAHRLLVTGAAAGKTEVVAIDCTGAVQVITRKAPVVEGGIAVAPSGFGAFGGALIAPDELSGVIWAIGPDGTAQKIADSGLPHGGDIGVESVGFVPPGFVEQGGDLYYADRLTPGNPHPGTDHVLRLTSVALIDAGVRDGDLLAATEGGASMIAVHCDTTCEVIRVVGAPTTAHGEGHFVFRLAPQSPRRPTPARLAPTKAASEPAPYLVGIGALVLLVALGAWLGLRRRRGV